MLKFDESKNLISFINSEKVKGSVIGFVPTMGALHEGHLSLIEQAQIECNIVICSVFVNPTQFNNHGDLINYPKDIEKDVILLEKSGCNAVFMPSVEEMYPKSLSTLKLNLDNIDKYLEGEHRPGHFEGVVTIVNKFFDLVQPHKAYFGQKDFQQYCVIKKMAEQLNNNIEVVVCPTKREPDGLAMSSRNRLLSNNQREIAPIIYKSLAKAAQQSPFKSVSELLEQIKEELASQKEVKLDYVEIADVSTLAPIKEWEQREKAQVFVAAFLGEVRLIDNITLER